MSEPRFFVRAVAFALIAEEEGKPQNPSEIIWSANVRAARAAGHNLSDAWKIAERAVRVVEPPNPAEAYAWAGSMAETLLQEDR